ncbi:transketolase family protein [Candidatus Giovannonibacteria bacterium]|nr:transketolase family protein [Candidatus Giovannonibacteria bacterium]
MPINPNAKLVSNVLDLKSVEQVPTRKGYGEGLFEAGEKDERIVALCADLTESTQMHLFAKKFPKRFIEIGVAEQNLAAVAAGLANYGKIPFISSYAMFSPGRNWEQIRTTICYNDVPVKIAGSHSGVSVGPDGATHQAIEDIAITRVIPNMVVIAPCDANEAKKATLAAAELNSPVYLRFTREKTPVCTTIETPFQIGRAEIFFESKKEKPDVAIISSGPLTHNALLAANDLEKDGMGVIVVNSHTIKPLDEKIIIETARKAGAIVTVEEHQIAGGMGSAVAELLSRNYPVPIEFVGVHDRFGESGVPGELITAFGMGVSDIKKASILANKRKS